MAAGTFERDGYEELLDLNAHCHTIHCNAYLLLAINRVCDRRQLKPWDRLCVCSRVWIIYRRSCYLVSSNRRFLLPIFRPAVEGDLLSLARRFWALPLFLDVSIEGTEKCDDVLSLAANFSPRITAIDMAGKKPLGR